MTKPAKITLPPEIMEQVDRRREIGPDTSLAAVPSPVLAERLIELAQDFKTMSDACDVLATFIVRAHDLLMVAKVQEAKASLSMAVRLINDDTPPPTHDAPRGKQ